MYYDNDLKGIQSYSLLPSKKGARDSVGCGSHLVAVGRAAEGRPVLTFSESFQAHMLLPGAVL